MTTVYLIRHGEAEGNLYRRAQGHYNGIITDRGYRQIAALARRFENVPVDAVYASDLLRTRTTALSVTLTHGLPLRTMPALREICVGEWENHTWAYLAHFYREELVRFNTDAATWHVSGGEDMSVLRERLTGALRTIINAHPNETVAVFSHGMALRLLLGTLSGLSISEIDRTPHGENTAVSRLEADETGIRIVYRDDASHLSDELTTLHRQLWTRSKGGLEPGIWFEPDGSAGTRFNVMEEDACVGGVGVSKLAEGVATTEEFWLEEAAQGRGYGIRLLGQAITCARSLGCDTLREAIPREDTEAIRRAVAYGYTPVQATPKLVVYEKYFGTDEDYCTARLRAAMEEG